MRFLSPLVLACLCSAAVALPQQSSLSAHNGGKPGAEVRDAKGVPAHEKVEPGECHTNGDGVQVCNTGDPTDGDFTVDPKSGNGNSATTVEAKNDAEGTVEGLDSNDTVNCANGSNTTISGTGGTVNANSGSTGSVSNTAAAGGASITVNVGGGSVTVPPGGTVTFAG
tara:strand:+ start:2793 stop:3296 length:504 start_codon:yes stop_codon:yes gene_type:complete